MASSTQNGYPALLRAQQRDHRSRATGWAATRYFNQGVDIQNSMAFQAPNTAGVQFHDLLTVFLNGAGGIHSVINGTGAAVSTSFGGPSDIVSYP